MKNLLSFFIVFCTHVVLGQDYNMYNITKSDYKLELSGSIGSNFKIGSGINMNNPNQPKATNLQAFSFKSGQNAQRTGNTQEQTISRFIEINNTSELFDMLTANFSGSYGSASGGLSYSKTKEMHESSQSIFLIIETVRRGEAMFEPTINWLNAPKSESMNTDNTNTQLKQFIDDYGSHYINSINHGYKIAIQGKYNSKNESESESFKASFKAGFGAAKAGGSISSTHKSNLTSEKVDIICEITSGGIIPEHSSVLYGFEQIKEFLDLLKTDDSEKRITIETGPISCTLKSYWHTLYEYPKTKNLLTIQEGEKAVSPFGVPKGTIISWFPGENPKKNVSGQLLVPDGWAICDGSLGTPNLVDRFIMGASEIDGIITGGSAMHTHSIGGNNSARRCTCANGGTNFPAPGHNHTAGESSNLPPYYALIYIMKL